MNDVLRERIRQLVQQIGPDGELRYRDRRALDHALDQDGRLWLMVEIICAREGFAVWERHFPGEGGLATLLADAELQLLEGERVIVDARLGSLRTFLDEKFLIGDEAFKPIYGGFACWAAAKAVATGRRLWADAPSEMDIEPVEWDAPFLASLAISGGAVWEGIGDTERRRRFWEWVLNEAVPQAEERMGQV